jgi:valyl-tRNA synthetase
MVRSAYEFIDIALRFTLLAYTSAGRDINLDVMRIEGYRKFCNKIWNAVKFYLKMSEIPVNASAASLSVSEKWILSKLNKATKEINESLEQMNFMQATSVLYNFWLYELCDVYIEICKTMAQPAAKTSVVSTLNCCLLSGLKLLHPMMPFLSEELYQRIRGSANESSICMASYPVWDSSMDYNDVEMTFEKILNIIKSIRSMTAQYNVKGATGNKNIAK